MSQEGLVLIVPLKFNEKRIPSILERHRSWIEKQYDAMQVDRANRAILPTEITLSALRQTWQIHYMQASSKSIEIIQRPHQELVLLGNVKDQIKCKKILLSWLREQATIHLVSWLNQLSNQTQLIFNEVHIRSQQSRWGSCSHTKNISLNDKLLFLPEQLVSYVILHELCHTRHLNHSVSFWQLLAKWDPHYVQRRCALRKVQPYMPTWI
jgi:predicted metal-dependent hydrolase